MKKEKETIELETLLGGIFGIIAVIAIVVEMSFGGFTKEAIAGGIKDLSGTLITIILLWAAITALKPKKTQSVREELAERMVGIKTKYAPMISEDNKEGVIRYNIASNLESLFGAEAKNPKRLFEIDEVEPKEIKFFINKSFFSKRGAEEFDAMSIAEHIQNAMLKVCNDFELTRSENGQNAFITIKFVKALTTESDMDKLTDIIDYAILLYIAENNI